MIDSKYFHYCLIVSNSIIIIKDTRNICTTLASRKYYEHNSCVKILFIVITVVQPCSSRRTGNPQHTGVGRVLGLLHRSCTLQVLCCNLSVLFVQSAYGGHGFSYILDYIVPKMLARGISQDDVTAFLTHNPQRWLTFTKQCL